MAENDPSGLKDQKSSDRLAKGILFTLLFYRATMLWTPLAESLDPHGLYLLRFMHLSAANNKSLPSRVLLWESWVWTLAILSLVIRLVCSWWGTKYIWSLCKTVMACWSSMVAAIAGLSIQGPIGSPGTQDPQGKPELLGPVRARGDTGDVRVAGPQGLPVSGPSEPCPNFCEEQRGQFLNVVKNSSVRDCGAIYETLKPRERQAYDVFMANPTLSQKELAAKFSPPITVKTLKIYLEGVRTAYNVKKTRDLYTAPKS